MQTILYRTAVLITGILVFSMGLMPDGLAQPMQKYGILDKKAPELSAEYWVDGKGKAVKRIRLSDYENKIIYMMFFQDW